MIVRAPDRRHTDGLRLDFAELLERPGEFSRAVQCLNEVEERKCCQPPNKGGRASRTGCGQRNEASRPVVPMAARLRHCQRPCHRYIPHRALCLVAVGR